MGKRYDPAKREAALACLAALGDFARTSELTGISTRSLRRWAREERLARQNAIKVLTRETESAADAAETRLREAQDRLEQTQAQLKQVRQQQTALHGTGSDSPHARLEQLALVNMLHEAMRLSESLGEAIDDAPLGQRATALNQLLDKILKIMALLPRQEEVLVRVEFQGEDATADEAPPWARADSDQ